MRRSVLTPARPRPFGRGDFSLDRSPDSKVSAVVKVRVMFYLRTPGTSTGPPATESGLVADDGGAEGIHDRQLPNVYSSSAAGVTPPTVRRSPTPQYTSEAMREKIQGSVELQLVIGVKGTVTAARVVRSLDARYGLNQQAVKRPPECGHSRPAGYRGKRYLARSRWSSHSSSIRPAWLRFRSATVHSSPRRSSLCAPACRGTRPSGCDACRRRG